MLRSDEMRNEMEQRGYSLVTYSKYRDIAERSIDDYDITKYERKVVESIDEYSRYGEHTIWQLYIRERKTKDELYKMLDHACRIIEMTNPEDGEKITTDILNGKGGLY